MNRTLSLTAPDSPDGLRTRLTAINGLLGLTERELDVLAVMVDLHASDPTHNRELVAAHLNSSVPVLNNTIKSLVEKGVLIRQEKHYSYNPLLRSITALSSITIQFQP